MDRFAVVSGGGTGIGAATAQALAEYGYDVLIAGRRAEVLAAAERIDAACGRPGSVTSVAADLTEPGHVERVAATLVGRAGEPADIAEAIRYLATRWLRHRSGARRQRRFRARPLRTAADRVYRS